MIVNFTGIRRFIEIRWS